MRRPGAARIGDNQAASVSLFPFLAVLICTMGALIVLLIVITRLARAQVIETARETAAADVDDPKPQQPTAEPSPSDLQESFQRTARQIELIARRRQAETRIAQWEHALRTAQEELSAARDRADDAGGRLEQLRRELAALEAAWNELQQTGAGDDQQRRELETELQRLAFEIEEAQEELDEARQEAADRPRSYAILPFDAVLGTYRRPVYIECRADEVVIQPEGIRLGEDDFPPGMRPGNPLDAAVHAVREYYRGQRTDEGQSVLAYPLLLIRPEGIAAHGRTRQALRGWQADFGYEYIGSDWNMAYPAPDPVLAERLRLVVEEARRRQRAYQEELKLAAPSLDRAQNGGRERRDTVTGAAGGNIGSGSGTGRGMHGGGSMSAGPRGTVMAPRDAGLPGGGQPGGGMPGGDMPGGTLPGGTLPGGTLPGGGVPGGGSPGGGSPSGGTPSGGTPSGGMPGGGSPAGGMGATSAQSGQPRRPGEWQPGESSANPSGSQSCDTAGPNVKSLAETRGRNWGLPQNEQGSIGSSRPIRIDCHEDRLVLGPSSDPTARRTIRLPSRTEDAVDPFVSAVWKHVDTWGIAGRDMYWRPILNIYVAPNGAQRFAELEALLSGSGLPVVRKR